MDTHYHLMVTPGDDKALARTMMALGRDYGGYYNRKHDRIGTIWNGRYTAIPILDLTYWLTCLRYIEQNPVRARMVADPSDYKWSTYRIHAFGQPPGWIDLHDTYLALGADAAQRQQAYREMCGISVSVAERVRLVSDPMLTPRTQGHAFTP
jgi:putative transposase